MRCYCCNVILTPQESVRKSKETGAYLDTCGSCLSTMDIRTTEGRAFSFGGPHGDELEDDFIVDTPTETVNDDASDDDFLEI